MKGVIMKLNNKIALITGGSRGLGKNSAFRLAENGTDVIITYHQQAEAADAVVKEVENQYKLYINYCDDILLYKIPFFYNYSATTSIREDCRRATTCSIFISKGSIF